MDVRLPRPKKHQLPTIKEPVEEVAARPFDAPEPDSKRPENRALDTSTRVTRGTKEFFNNR